MAILNNISQIFFIFLANLYKHLQMINLAIGSVNHIPIYNNFNTNTWLVGRGLYESCQIFPPETKKLKNTVTNKS